MKYPCYFEVGSLIQKKTARVGFDPTTLRLTATRSTK